MLLVLLIAAGAVGWNLVDTEATGQIRFPGWLLVPLFAAVGVAFLTMFKPELARFTGPIYALLEGLVLGAISRLTRKHGTASSCRPSPSRSSSSVLMAFLYATRIIKVTERFRRIVIGATLAIVVFYVISMLLSIFGASVPLIWDAGPFGILFSLFVCGIAAFNLALDFDLAERGVKSGLPKQFEWFCAFALTVSLVWLYLEVLRLLGKLRQ